MHDTPKYIEVDDRLINERHITQIIKIYKGKMPVLEIRFDTPASPITIRYKNESDRQEDFELISGSVYVHSRDLRKTLKGVIDK
jgi:hypothetical protein